MSAICKSCQCTIPAGRVSLGYNVCVDCSTEEAVACVDITYHKTGNTIQITDKETARRINKLAARSGYGIMRGLRGGKSSTDKTTLSTTPRNIKPIREYTHSDLERVLEVAIDWMEMDCRDRATAHVEKALANKQISGIQRRRIMEILATMFPEPVVENTCTQESIDPEIEFAFRNWRNSRIYK